MSDDHVGPADALANPVINRPYDAPTRHFVMGPNGPTGEITLTYLKQFMRFENFAVESPFSYGA